MRIPFIPILLAFGLFPYSASAEVIYLKNGTHIEGRILKQTKEDINVQLHFEYGGVLDIPKAAIDIVPPPSPTAALALGLVFPGGGQIYLGRLPDAFLYLGLTTLAASVGLGLGSVASSNGSTLGAGLAALVPWLVGSLEARRFAIQEAKEVRFKVEYP